MSITVTTINPVSTIKEMPLSRSRPHILLSNNNGASSASNDSCISQSDCSSDHLPSLLKYSQILEKSNAAAETKLTKKCAKPSSLDVIADKAPSNNSIDHYLENKDALYGVRKSATSCLQPINKQQDESITAQNAKITSLSKPKKKGYTPVYVCNKFNSSLSKFEKIEIFRFPEVYFFGIQADKKLRSFNGIQPLFDNDQGGYVFVPHDHVGYRYELLKVIGKGSFGQVVKAYDHKHDEHVALKIVRNETRFYQQAQEEIRILGHLRKQDVHNLMNIIHMFDSFTFRKHVCITFELLSINLYELIKKNKYQGFSLQLVRKFSHSLLVCLDALYHNKIIHCDMKPENVLLKQHGRSGIKVILTFRISVIHFTNYHIFILYKCTILLKFPFRTGKSTFGKCEATIIFFF